MVKNNDSIILGIDPGFAITGFAILAKQKNELKVIDYGVIKTLASENFDKRLKKIYIKLNQIIKKYQPQVLAIEDLFFGKNAKTAIKVGQARGVIILCAALNKLKIYDFTPLQIKQAVTTYGRAEKIQIQKMIKMLLNLETIPHPDDAADALAVAYTCAQSLTTKYD